MLGRHCYKTPTEDEDIVCEYYKEFKFSSKEGYLLQYLFFVQYKQECRALCTKSFFTYINLLEGSVFIFSVLIKIDLLWNRQCTVEMEGYTNVIGSQYDFDDLDIEGKVNDEWNTDIDGSNSTKLRGTKVFL